ncbi:MAG TPA: LysM peptidoglycan-binding domain-containing protein [Candidatus Eisenbacteria bacterium]|jgi:membrane-bound lytic murein transglycosylase D
MNPQSKTIILLWALAVAILPPAMALADPAGLAAGAASSDTATASPAAALASARSAYETAWALREAGDYPISISIAEQALAAIDEVLKGDLDATNRRDLVDLRSKLGGLRDAAQHKLDTGSSEGANVADAGVLNQPAIDGIQPQFNQDVYRWIDFFTGAGRSHFELWLRRSGRYVDLFRTVLKREGLPPDLVHLVFVESGFNVNARSVSAAVGPWQFLRSTGRLFGLTVNQWVDERRDPEKSTVAAARYLKHLYSIFQDWPLALASYNAGEGKVLRAIKQQGTTNYWDLRLPRQTEEYVPKFMAALAIVNDPARYGFGDIELEEPIAFDEITFKGPVDLRVVAKLAGCTYEDLKKLNPAARAHTFTGPNGVTTLRVPDGAEAQLMERLAAGEKMEAVSLTFRHRVRRGETLQGIANRYRVSAQQLAEVNGIGREHPLRRGEVLTVPGSLRSAAPQILETSDPRASTAYVPERTIRTPATLDGNSTAEGRFSVIVRRGETLSQIAERYQVSTDDLVRWNHLSTSRLRRGMRLKVRTGEAAQAQLSQADSTMIASLPVRMARGRRTLRSPLPDESRARDFVVVRSGDTLSDIAKRSGVTIAALKRANGLNSSRIRAGWKLKIPA